MRVSGHSTGRGGRRGHAGGGLVRQGRGHQRLELVNFQGPVALERLAFGLDGELLERPGKEAQAGGGVFLGG